jgi:hypothetical protein
MRALVPIDNHWSGVPQVDRSIKVLALTEAQGTGMEGGIETVMESARYAGTGTSSLLDAGVGSLWHSVSPCL